MLLNHQYVQTPLKGVVQGDCAVVSEGACDVTADSDVHMQEGSHGF